MNKNNDIEKKIKESFGGLNKSAPDNLWNKLSGTLSVSDMDKSIDTKIKDGFENTNKSAPTHVWNSVNKQLNIDRVWKRISAELDRRPLFYWKKIAGIAALLLLLVGGGFYLFNNSNTLFVPDTGQLNKQEQKNAEEFQQLAAISHKGDLAEKNKNHPGIAKTFNLKKYPAQQNGLTSRKDRTVPVSSEKNKNAANSAVQKFNSVQGNITEKNLRNTLNSDSMPLIAMKPLKTILIENGIAPDSIIISSTITQLFIPADTMHRRKKQFELGIIYSYNNTWILNNDTRKSFDENSLIQTIPTYSGSYGIVANYTIFNNSSVSTEFFVNSKYIQRYDEFMEGNFNRWTTKFNYYKLTLLYQFNISQSRYKAVPSKYTFRAGFYGSYLKNQTKDYTRVTSPETDTYTKADYGARIAIGQEKIFRIIIIGYGLNAEYGFKNIFDGNPQVPSQFNVSRNALIGGYLNLKYAF